MSAGRWLSVAESAERLGVDRHTLYDAAGRGEIPEQHCRRVGRRVLISEAWLDTHGFGDVGNRSGPDEPVDRRQQLRAALHAAVDAFVNVLERDAAPERTGATLTLASDDEGVGRERTA